ncbi:hypothetical protein BDN67DRAFT_974948, partial [Paxillus ammoniavirescens]
MKQLTEALDVSTHSINCWADNYKQHGRVNPPSPISTTALHSNLRDIGLRLKVLKHTASQWDEVSRTQWRIKMLSTYASHQLIFVDKCNKDGRTL